MGSPRSRPVTVMHIIARMNVGGPAVEITELMRGLAPETVSQYLVTGYCDEDEADFLDTQATGIQAIRIKGLGRSLRPTDDLRAFLKLVKLIRQFQPDVVHTHTAKAGVLGRVAARASGTRCKIIHTHHGHLLHGYFGPTKTKAVIQLERQLSKITDRIITVGDKVRDDLLEADIGNSNQYIVIRSGVRLGPLPDKQTARKEIGLPEGSVVVSMVGRLTKIKRLDRFADIVAIVKQGDRNVHFLVVGGGDQQHLLLERVKHERLPVSMLGWRSDLERILAATDILLLTSDNEGLPLSLIEAAKAQVPVVASNVGSVSEFVRDGVTGLLGRPSAAELADLLIELVEDPQRRARMGTQAMKYANLLAPHRGFLDGHQATYELIVSSC